MKHWNNHYEIIKVVDKRQRPKNKRVPRVYAPGITPYMQNLLDKVSAREEEREGKREPYLHAKEMLAYLSHYGDKTIVGLCRELHLKEAVALKVVKHLEDRGQVTTWVNKRKYVMVGGA